MTLCTQIKFLMKQNLWIYASPTEMSINFGISGWSSLRKLRQVVNAHLFQHFILLILPVVLQCTSNPVLLEIINWGSEEKR